MSIGENIQQHRKELHMTLDDLSAKVGVSKQTLSRYENGKIANIPPERVAALATVLQTTPSELLGWAGEIIEVEKEEAQSGRSAAKEAMFRTYGAEHTAESLRLCGDKIAVLFYKPMDRNSALELMDLIQTVAGMDMDGITNIREIVQAYLCADAPIREIVDVALKPYRVSLDDLLADR